MLQGLRGVYMQTVSMSVMNDFCFSYNAYFARSRCLPFDQFVFEKFTLRATVRIDTVTV